MVKVSRIRVGDQGSRPGRFILNMLHMVEMDSSLDAARGYGDSITTDWLVSGNTYQEYWKRRDITEIVLKTV